MELFELERDWQKIGIAVWGDVIRPLAGEYDVCIGNQYVESKKGNYQDIGIAFRIKDTAGDYIVYRSDKQDNCWTYDPEEREWELIGKFIYT